MFSWGKENVDSFRTLSGGSVAAPVEADEGSSWGTTTDPVLSRGRENGGFRWRSDTVARSGLSATVCVRPMKGLHEASQRIPLFPGARKMSMASGRGPVAR